MLGHDLLARRNSSGQRVADDLQRRPYRQTWHIFAGIVLRSQSMVLEFAPQHSGELERMGAGRVLHSSSSPLVVAVFWEPL